MDLLPGPTEDAAVARVRPLLDAHLGAVAWGRRLRDDEPVPPDVIARLSAAAGRAAGVTDATVVAVELGRTLAPIEVLTAMVAGAPAAAAVPHPAGGFTLFGPHDAAVVVVWGDEAVGLTDPPTTVDTRACLDPTTPMARATLTEGRALDGAAAARSRSILAGYLAGLARGAQDLAVEHAKTRVQFDRPIGANQAVKHALAECATRTEAAWATVLYGATALAEQHPEPHFWLAAAVRTATAAADANARTAIQVHGGRGYTLECPAHLYLARARLVTQLLGGADRIRAQLLGRRADGRDLRSGHDSPDAGRRLPRDR
ncbi:MAG: hypothetical protein FJW95_00725 [Actinobacteria bacterium]|nr:hypothetical protein [Actinomycetota bacterium]